MSLAIASLSGMLAPLTAAANSTSDDGTWSLVLENDIFSGTDRNYTNGLGVSWLPPEDAAPEWLASMARGIPWLPKNGTARSGYMVGQSVFTAKDISLANPPETDRPYAGWLYGAVALRVETEGQLDQVGLSLGIVGPASLAEQGQKLFHRAMGSQPPRGWDTQLGNEPGVVLTYQRTLRGPTIQLGGQYELDLLLHMGGAFGNIFTYAGTGATWRYGKHLPRDFGPLRVQPSLPGSGLFIPRKDFSWYVFGGLGARAVAHNIFLDGNSFRDSRSVGKEPFVGDFQFGGVIAWRKVRLSYTHVLRTPEFANQPGNDGFGALSLSFPYR